MDWEISGLSEDRLMLPKCDRMRSLSTSTPIVSAQDGGKLFRSHSISTCSANDSGLGDSIEADNNTFSTPTFSLNVSRGSHFSNTTESSVCKTPQTSLCETTLCGRHLDFSFSSFSPVLNFNNFLANRSVDSDSFISHSLDETVSDESEQNLSRLNLDSVYDSVTSDDSVPAIPKLNLNLDTESSMPCLPNRKLNIKSNLLYESHHYVSPTSGKASPQLEVLLKQFLPGEADRLIGPKMGRDHVDIITELQYRGMNRLLSTIMSHLDTQDLCSFHRVSKSWQTVVETDRNANKRRKEFFRKKKKPQFHGKENLRKKSPSPPPRNVTGASVLQALGNLQLQNPTAQITPKQHNTRLDLFVEASKLLKSDERLQKCPKCCKPAKVLPVQERGICLQSDCTFDFCTKCCNEFHRSKPCISAGQKRPKTDSVGTKKSKKNLKRL